MFEAINSGHVLTFLDLQRVAYNSQNIIIQNKTAINVYANYAFFNISLFVYVKSNRNYHAV